MQVEMVGGKGLRVPARWPLARWPMLLVGLAALLLAALWLQAQLLDGQSIDVGTKLDASNQYRFYGGEYSTSLPGASGPVAATYRWARPRSALYFGPLLPDAPYELALRMLGPAPDARLDLAANARPLGTISLDAAHLRVYRLLIAPAWLRDGALELGLDGQPSRFAADPRRPIVLVDSARIERLGSATRIEPLLLASPYLPLGVALLFLTGCGLRLAGPLPLLPPALSLLGIFWLLRNAAFAARSACQLLLAVAVLACFVIAFVALLRALPRLWPRSDRAAAAWVLAGFVVALLLFFTPRIASDGVLYYVYLRSLAIDGDWDFGNEFSAQSTLDHVLEVDASHRLPSGYFGNAASVGPAIVWAPFFGLAHLIVLGGQQLGLPWQADGYALPYLVLIGLASALATLVTMLGCYQICQRFVAPASAALAVLALLFGSNLLFYGLAEGSFAHALSAMTATLLVLAWLRLEAQPSTARWAQLGLAAGAMVLMYWITALLLLMPLLSGLRLLGTAARQRDWPAALRVVGQGTLALILALLLISPQLIAWSIIYGAPLAAPHGGDYIRPQSFQIQALLFSPLYGLLPWTPAFFLGLLGLMLVPLRRPWLGLCMLAACLLYIGYNASLGRWFAGGSFGLRRLTACAPFFALGLALIFARLARWRLAAPAVVAALICAWALAVLVRYQGYMLSHSAYSLKFMSTLQFYFDGNALPLWALPGLLGNSYPLSLLRGLGSASGWLYLGLLGTPIALGVAGVAGGYYRWGIVRGQRG